MKSLKGGAAAPPGEEALLFCRASKHFVIAPVDNHGLSLHSRKSKGKANK